MKDLYQTGIIQQLKTNAQKIVDPSEKSDKIAQTVDDNFSNSHLKLLTDQNLYQLCKTYGERARIWRQKFTGLLPEVFRRKLYEKKGFSSIFEFAKKLAGMSEEQVRLVLNLEKRFDRTPALKSLLVNGKVSINKLARIVSIAKPENEKFLANQVQILSKGAVETLVRDENNNHNGLFKPGFDTKSLPGQTLAISSYNESSRNTLRLSPEVHQKLLNLQQKGIDINNLLLELLQNREKEIENKKQQIAEQIAKKEKQKEPTRYIPKPVKVILQEEYGRKCSIENCSKQSITIHHTRRFALFASHNPYYLAPLCKEHHELAHSIDANYHKMKKP